MEDLRATFLTLDTSLSNAIPYLINLLLTTQLSMYLLFLSSSPLPEAEQEEAVSRLRAKKQIMWGSRSCNLLALLSLCEQRRRLDRRGFAGRQSRTPFNFGAADNLKSVSVSLSFIVLSKTKASK